MNVDNRNIKTELLQKKRNYIDTLLFLNDKTKTGYDKLSFLSQSTTHIPFSTCSNILRLVESDIDEAIKEIDFKLKETK